MATTSMPVGLRADGLTKTYPGGRGKASVQALDDLTFTAEAGTIFGLLGPNGAGKSTTVKILATLTRADSGTAEVAGIDVMRHPDQVRRAIGFVAQRPVCDPMDTGKENLLLAGRLQGMAPQAAHRRATELLERFSLTDAAARQVKTYSGGMVRKLDVAIGLMHRPSVLFLDEPTTGLDPQARAQMWSELEMMAAVESMTVLLTTHYLEEADRLADQVAIIDNGQVAVQGSPEELKSAMRGDAVVVELTSQEDIDEALQTVSALEGLNGVTAAGRTLRARADAGATSLPQVLAALEDREVAVTSATVSRPSLDDVYLTHIGKALVIDEEEAA
jgi:ABC-2 type transport system ATP-binding protein